MTSDQRKQENKWSPRAWHRKASRPVTVWMAVFIAVGLTHTFIPEARWVMVHIFTLGILTNSIVVWSQNLTERFLQARLRDADRPPQLLRIRLLNLAIVFVVTGQLLAGLWEWHWVVTAVGATGVAAVMAWHAVALASQIVTVDHTKRFYPAALGFICASLALPLGALFGAALAAGLPGQWQSRVLAAHVYINVGGFVGLTALSALTVLLPAMWRARGVRNRASTSVALCATGVVTAAAGALLALPPLEALGLFVYVAGWAWSLQGWLATLLGARRTPTYPALSALASAAWLVAAQVAWGVQLVAGREMVPPTLMLLLGFAAQLLFGTMSFLLPTNMGGGPAAVRAGMRRFDTAGVFRFVVYNLALIVWLVTDSSWLRVVMSMLVFVVLVAFVPLMISAVKTQRAVMEGKQEGPGVAYDPKAGRQTLAALGVVGALSAAILLAL
ncbi:copper oxidase [Corynebacterium sp. LK2510]|uniref:copper oxidase n=1 Tax=Corynebacterium sp. LK2510 TaxID=3110472 RepID=UPI0034CEF5C4